MGEVWDRQLPATRKIVLLALADHADQNGICWPGQERLAEVTGLGIRTVRETLKDLESSGLIETNPKHGPTGQRLGTIYKVLARQELPVGQLEGPAKSAGQQARQPAKASSRPAAAAAKPTNKKPTTKSSSSDVEKIFAYWAEKMGKPRAKLNSKRRRKVEARLAEGYSREDLLAAIDGCAKSPWHMGTNPDSRQWNDLELICRDGSKVESFMEIAAGKAKAESSWGRFISA